MGKTLEDKQAIVADLKQELSESQLAVIIDYKGLTVAEISDLRGRLRESGAVCKIAKNTLMRKAIEGDDNWAAMTEFLAGNSAFILLKEDLSGPIKAYQGFQKDTKKTELRGGVMEGRPLTEDDIEAVTKLPTKPELMARIAGMLNANTTKLARGINAVPTKLARGINEVPGKLARALKQVAEKEQGDSAESN